MLYIIVWIINHIFILEFLCKKTPSYCHKKFPSLKIESLSTKNQFEYKTSVFLWVYYISRFHSTFLEFWVWKRNKKDFCHILLPEDMWFIITHHTNMISQREFISIKFILCWHRSKYHRIFQKILYILLGTKILTVILHKQHHCDKFITTLFWQAHIPNGNTLTKKFFIINRCQSSFL